MKYPTDTFQWIKIDEGTFPELFQYEQIYIDLFDTYNCGYNKSHGGEGSVGHVWSDGAKRRMSEIKKGRPAWNKGIKHTAETRAKMAEAKRGKPGNNTGNRHSDATKAKMSESRKRYLRRLKQESN